MTADEFLDWPGDGSGRKFELVDGGRRPASPASSVHSVIQARMAQLLWNAIEAAGSDRVRAGVHRRSADGTWPDEPEVVDPGQRLRLASAELDAAIERAFPARLTVGR